MGQKIEFTGVVLMALIGQIGGQCIVHLVGPMVMKSFVPGLIPALIGVGVGVGVMFFLIWLAVGVLYLLNKIGVIDLKKYNDNHPGFQ